MPEFLKENSCCKPLTDIINSHISTSTFHNGLKLADQTRGGEGRGGGGGGGGGGRSCRFSTFSQGRGHNK